MSSDCETRDVTTRDEIHHLVDAVPETQLEAVERMLRSGLESRAVKVPRRFASRGTLSAEPDLAARHDERPDEYGPEDEQVTTT